MFKYHVLAITVALSLPVANAQDTTSKTTFPRVSEQQTEGPARRPHLGVTLGSLNPDNSFSTAFEYGIDAGFQPIVPLGVGIEISQANSERAEGNRSQDLNRTTILPRATYNLGGNIPVIKNSYLGLGMGAIIDDGSPNQGTHFGFAPLAGFDIPLVDSPTSNYMSLGVGTKYMFVSGPSPDSFSVNGLVKYWF